MTCTTALSRMMQGNKPGFVVSLLPKKKTDRRVVAFEDKTNWGLYLRMQIMVEEAVTIRLLLSQFFSHIYDRMIPKMAW